MTSTSPVSDEPEQALPRQQRSNHRRRRRLIIVGPLLVLLMAPLAITYIHELKKPGFASTEARTAQWARDWHLGPIVDWAERRRYETDQFAIGGEPAPAALEAIPTTSVPVAAGETVLNSSRVNDAASTTTQPTRTHLEPPLPIQSPAAFPLPSEGAWAPTGPLIDGFPGVYVTAVRPDAEHTSLLVFAAWIDPTLTSVELHPGSDLPGGTWDRPSSIPSDRCADLIFAGNGGFRMEHSRGGFYLEGREQYQLIDGAASLVVFKDGTVDIATWGVDIGTSDLSRIDSVRQNLELMVDNGQPAAALDTTDWGALLKKSALVWRSGWGISREGGLIYVGGPALSVTNLTRILIDAGAVRAMEGDINPSWVTGNTYSVDETGKCFGTAGLPQPAGDGGMSQPGDRYLAPDTRDFIAVLANPLSNH